METLLVTDNTEAWAFAKAFTRVVSSTDYLMQPEFMNEKSLRIINLCRSYQYQSLGYYVSLLAEARQHKVLPSVTTMQDIKTASLASTISESISEDIQHALKNLKSDNFTLSVYFGRNVAKCYNNLCKKLHSLFPFPLFRVYFKYHKSWAIHKIEPLSFQEIYEHHRYLLNEITEDYFAKKRFRLHRRKACHYDLAILHNPNELNPPSDKEALKKFIEAGDALKINVELIEKEDFKFLGEYDALFIRETTSVNHHTYRFARKASSEQLVVIDDPLSILRCSNKVYLAELLHKHHFDVPATYILSKYNYKEIKAQLAFPCVLKRPDSAFSHGVVKVENLNEFEIQTNEFFKSSDLIIMQSFTPSEYDWRIGIINQQPLFACRYYMAKGHWQIYNWASSSAEENSGDFEAVPIDAVPKPVLHTALKAAKLIGDGLYGVDLKQFGNTVHVIEVNDNPSIDYNIEDAILGDELYLTIMQTFLTRIRKGHGYE